jgi:hypothetical protein
MLISWPQEIKIDSRVSRASKSIPNPFSTQGEKTQQMGM